MLFRWLRNRRRRKIFGRRFPDAWLRILQENAVYLEAMEPSFLPAIHRSIQVFLQEKNWEGCGGLKLADVHRVTIAAQIAKMTLGLGAGETSGEYFDEVHSILVYPDAYVAKTQQPIGSGVVLESQAGRVGEAWHRGPVVLAWNDVLATGRRQSFARNVVIHEFAHHLDMRNSPHADGVPVIEQSEKAKIWTSTMQRGLARLQAECRQGTSRVLDCYGATSLAEFFAVGSEAYFEEPHALQAHWPEVFALLDQFYFPDLDAEL